MKPKHYLNPRSFEDVLSDYFNCNGIHIPCELSRDLCKSLYVSRQEFVPVHALQLGPKLLVAALEQNSEVRHIYCLNLKKNRIEEWRAPS